MRVLEIEIWGDGVTWLLESWGFGEPGAVTCEVELDGDVSYGEAPYGEAPWGDASYEKMPYSEAAVVS